VLAEAGHGPTVASLLRHAAQWYGGEPMWQVAHDVVRRHAQPQTVPFSPFQNEVSQIFQTEVLQTLNTKVVKQVTLFNNAKDSRVVIHWFEHKL
jgi:hypothetical protein